MKTSAVTKVLVEALAAFVISEVLDDPELEFDLRTWESERLTTRSTVRRGTYMTSSPSRRTLLEMKVGREMDLPRGLLCLYVSLNI